MRTLVLLSLSLVAGCGGSSFTSADPATETDAQTSEDAVPSPTMGAQAPSLAMAPTSEPDSGMSVQVSEAGTVSQDAGTPPTTHDSGSTTEVPDTGSNVVDSGMMPNIFSLCAPGTLTCVQPGTVCCQYGNGAMTALFCTAHCM